MYQTLLITHSWSRWAVLILAIIVIVQSWIGWQNGQNFTNGHRKMSLFLLIASHLQLILGLLLYFVYSPNGMKAFEQGVGFVMTDSNLRFWAVEHISTMLIAIVLIQIGYSKAKRATDSVLKHKHLAIFTTIGIVLILLRISWTPLFRF
jgi:hypothetical protein